ncbi:MAG: GAF domain-containing SpoIIE family protein phosphatase, partial [Actinomycetota bacterium]
LRTPEETLQTAVRLVPQMFSAQRCFAARLDPREERATVVASWGYDEDSGRDLVEAAARPHGLPLLIESLRERVPLLVGDVTVDSRLAEEASRRRGLGAYVILPLIRWGAEFGGLGVEFDVPRPFGPREHSLARGVARLLGVALTNARQLDLMRELRAAGLKVGSALRLTQVVGEVLASGARLLSGDGSILFFIDAEHRTLVRAAAWGAADSPHEALTRVSLDEEPWAELPTGVTVVIPELGGGERPRSGVAVAIAGPGEALLGALLVVFERPRGLGADELEALTVFAAQCAVAVGNANRYERQRRLARSLQEGLLATETPEMESCRVGAVYEPAGGEADIGGDFFDVYELPDGRVAVVVGDVSGKGAEAAAQTAMAKYMLRAFATRNAAPSSVLFHLNNALAKGFQGERFTTLAYGVCDLGDLRLQLAVAGHPPPLIYRRAGAEVEVVALEGPILGVFEGQQFDHVTLELSPGDVFLAYTDGLTEARRDGELYGLERVKQSLRDNASIDAQSLARAVYEDALSFGNVTDDTVVFAFQCLPEDE